MKINKYVEDLKAKTSAELNEELVAAKKELFNLRFQNATNQLDNTSRIKEVRRNIARIPVSYTHLDVYKRQVWKQLDICGQQWQQGDEYLEEGSRQSLALSRFPGQHRVELLGGRRILCREYRHHGD